MQYLSHIVHGGIHRLEMITQHRIIFGIVHGGIHRLENYDRSSTASTGVHGGIHRLEMSAVLGL